MEPRKYLGYKAIGELFDVSAATVSKWRTRYEGTDYPCPAPTVWIDETPGWDSPTAWKAWKLALPGQGAGGGPLPIAQARDEYQQALQRAKAQHPDDKQYRLERRAFIDLATAYGTDLDTLTTLAWQTMDKNPGMPFEDTDILAIAAMIRSSRKTKSA